jgi:hypothetical protein
LLTLVALSAGCSGSGHDGVSSESAGSGGAAAPVNGGGAAIGSGGAHASGASGTGGGPASTGLGSGGSVATGSGRAGGGAVGADARGSGGATASGTGGVPARHVDAGADAGRADAAADAGAFADSGAGGRGAAPLFSPVYRIALRVHRGDSALTDAELSAVLDEMNWIWWSQAAICFEIEVVSDDQTMQDGFDFWFHKDQIPCSPGANGVYCGDHDIHSLDRPNLTPADTPAWNVMHLPSRTSAHELGHGLTLQHYDGHPDSNDSLMSSGHQGFELHDFEITAARMRANEKKLADTGALHCAVPML